MQTESELKRKKHEFRVIYIIAEKNCTILEVEFFETFIKREALSVEAFGNSEQHGESGRLGAQQRAFRHQQHFPNN